MIAQALDIMYARKCYETWVSVGDITSLHYIT